MKFSNQLQQIMEHFSLTTTELADKILVPKATISHLISERNKPSLEFIMKLHTHFPSLNLEWLIYGKEPFLVGGIVEEKVEKSISTSAPISLLFQENEEEKIDEKVNQNLIEEVSEKNLERHSKVEEEIPIKIFPLINENSNRTIESIVVFYSDGSFKRYTQQ